MAGQEFLTITETASTLGVSTRHARRLADSGALSWMARGLINRASVDRYLHSHSQGRTRAWAEHTAWRAVALLAGRHADWLGATQAARLRHNLREITEVDDLLSRMRDRAQVRIYEAHRAALTRLRERVAVANTRSLGITDPMNENIDGYVAADNLNDIVRALGLRPDPGGAITLRATGFDFTQVRELVNTPVVAALDVATSTDPRLRGVGRRALRQLLEAYR